MNNSNLNSSNELSNSNKFNNNFTNFEQENSNFRRKDYIEFKPIDYKEEMRKSKLRYMDFDIKTN